MVNLKKRKRLISKEIYIGSFIEGREGAALGRKTQALESQW